jgi:catechol 2,3-dioxygenase-like lactoylglutathione lyase family enzyme
MSNLLGPDFITLLVRDLNVSHHFYSKLIGLKESPEKRPNAFAFATRPCGFAIRKSSDSNYPAANPGQGVIIWFRSDDAASLYTVLRERAVPITTDLADGPFGKTFTFRDPDGYLITVHDGG